jgi:unsaturated rhamnogalacturonyl hydrolase
VDARVPLLYHGYSDASGEHIGLLWGRGAGWALLRAGRYPGGLACPHQARDILLANFRSLAATLRDLQAESGDWHTVLDHPETYLEPSIAFFVCAAFRKAMRAGLLESSFEACANRSWDACTRAISGAGQILVSEATPEGDLASYQALRLGVYPWGQGLGQGPALRAIDELLQSSVAAL